MFNIIMSIVVVIVVEKFQNVAVFNITIWKSDDEIVAVVIISTRSMRAFVLMVLWRGWDSVQHNNTAFTVNISSNC